VLSLRTDRVGHRSNLRRVCGAASRLGDGIAWYALRASLAAAGIAPGAILADLTLRFWPG
jgi:hypothetical protein